jgi:hypothetical protein
MKMANIAAKNSASVFDYVPAYRVVDYRGVVLTVGTFADCRRLVLQRKDATVKAFA